MTITSGLRAAGIAALFSLTCCSLSWQEADGIVVVDYNWCVGCRYCIAACPYDARRFNWADPVVP